MSYFSALMGNELWWGSDKSSEVVHGICHVSHPSSFSHERRKKDSFLNWEINNWYERVGGTVYMI